MDFTSEEKEEISNYFINRINIAEELVSELTYTQLNELLPYGIKLMDGILYVIENAKECSDLGLSVDEALHDKIIVQHNIEEFFKAIASIEKHDALFFTDSQLCRCNIFVGQN